MKTPKEICQFVDLTSLNSYDSSEHIVEFLTQAKSFYNQGYEVAAVCLYSNFAKTAIEQLKDTAIQVAVVAGNFPSAQGFWEIRLKECELAVKAGVDEVDVVINLGAFDEGDDTTVVNEIKAYKELLADRVLKVILETGYLKTPCRIEKASRLAIEGGADFIKTSTRKEFPGASIEAVEVMAKTIRDTNSKDQVGLKVSGGVRTYQDALSYLACIERYLGKDYITPKKVRIGASSLVRNLINA